MEALRCPCLLSCGAALLCCRVLGRRIPRARTRPRWCCPFSHTDEFLLQGTQNYTTSHTTSHTVSEIHVQEQRRLLEGRRSLIHPTSSEGEASSTQSHPPKTLMERWNIWVWIQDNSKLTSNCAGAGVPVSSPHYFSTRMPLFTSTGKLFPRPASEKPAHPPSSEKCWSSQQELPLWICAVQAYNICYRWPHWAADQWPDVPLSMIRSNTCLGKDKVKWPTNQWCTPTRRNRWTMQTIINIFQVGIPQDFMETSEPWGHCPMIRWSWVTSNMLWAVWILMKHRSLSPCLVMGRLIQWPYFRKGCYYTNSTHPQGRLPTTKVSHTWCKHIMSAAQSCHMRCMHSIDYAFHRLCSPLALARHVVGFTRLRLLSRTLGRSNVQMEAHIDGFHSLPEETNVSEMIHHNELCSDGYTMPRWAHNVQMWSHPYASASCLLKLFIFWTTRSRYEYSALWAYI